jgi:Ca2+-binding RTX toxin-like protein
VSLRGKFESAARHLTFTGDQHDNSIVIGRDAAGHIFGNGGAIAIHSGDPTVANTDLIRAFGGAGNDTIRLDETNGPLTAAVLFGGQGNDVLTGGSHDDQLAGQQGNDTLSGGAGNDLLLGGAGNDTLVGGAGVDHFFGDGGNDRMIWNPGDGTDTFEGGDGIDTAEINGAGADETFTAAASGGRIDFDRVSPGPFSIDIGSTENLTLNMGGGNDSFSATGDLASLVRLTVDGGAGNDTINGGNGDDTLIGGDGNDFIDGNAGKDVAMLGAGDDVFRWDAGDGSDHVDGGTGSDELLFNGAAGAEAFVFSADGTNASLTRDAGNILMNLTGIEKVTLNALAGADTITVNDPSGSGLHEFDINLGVGSLGDGFSDTIAINDDDDVQVTNLGNGNLSIADVSGAVIHITGFEAGSDHLLINGDVFAI